MNMVSHEARHEIVVINLTVEKKIKQPFSMLIMSVLATHAVVPNRPQLDEPDSTRAEL